MLHRALLITDTTAGKCIFIAVQRASSRVEVIGVSIICFKRAVELACDNVTASPLDVALLLRRAHYIRGLAFASDYW